MKKLRLVLCLVAVLSFSFVPGKTIAQTATESGSVGVSGVVSAPPPANPPVISVPGSGSSFSSIPITIGGICTGDLLVKVFKNNVFTGSVQCQNGSFSMTSDLFSGQNILTAKQYDLLDQESPESNAVTVTYTESTPTPIDRLTLTTNFAKRGADPNQELVWPFAISGGTGPYAIEVNWGDGETTLYSVPIPGEFDVKHTYKSPGSYTVIIKAVDVNNRTAILQVVAIANGSLSQTDSRGNPVGSGGTTTDGGGEAEPRTRILWQPAAIMIPFILTTFWLGKRYAIHRLRKKIEAGERPFSF